MSTVPALRAFEDLPPHLVIRDFLGRDMIARLLAHVEASREAFIPTSVADGRVDPEIRISLILSNFGPLRDTLAARFRAVMDQAVADLRLSPFELERLELELVAHGDGAFYRRHVDTRTSRADETTDRALTSVFYFHAEPRNYRGGELRLYSILPPDRGGCFLDITPEQDMLLLFPSWVPHEVRPIICPSGAFMDRRFAINCWYRRRRAS